MPVVMLYAMIYSVTPEEIVSQPEPSFSSGVLRNVLLHLLRLDPASSSCALVCKARSISFQCGKLDSCCFVIHYFGLFLESRKAG
jgi:hypothetical protein